MPCRELLCRCSCNIHVYACWPIVLLSQIPLLFKHAYWLMLLQDGCLLDFDHTISMPADLLSPNIACLLALCVSTCYTCWYVVSLSAVPAGVVLHYRSCLLVWYITICHGCWCGISLSDMHVGVVPHYRSCLLVWCHTFVHVFWCGASLYVMAVGVVLTIGHACWSILRFNRHFDYLSADGRGMATVRCYS